MNAIFTVELHHYLDCYPGSHEGDKSCLRHEAAVQAGDDQAIGLRLLLGGERHHGALQLGMDRGAPLRLPGCQPPLHGHGVHARYDNSHACQCMHMHVHACTYVHAMGAMESIADARYNAFSKVSTGGLHASLHVHASTFCRAAGAR